MAPRISGLYCHDGDMQHLPPAAPPVRTLPRIPGAPDTDSEIFQDGCRLAKGALASWYRPQSRHALAASIRLFSPPGVEQLNVMHATHAMKAPKRGDYKEMVSI
ncbi:hypothetical protein EMIT0162MI3_20852 [Pseudomonas chlororaphis]